MQLNIHVGDGAKPMQEQLPDQSHPFLYFRADRKMVKVFLEDILFIESLKDYIKVVTENKVIISKQSISSLDEMLPKDAFVRVHRSYIIALNKIDSYNTDLIEIGKKEIPIGRLFRHDVNRRLNISSVKNTVPREPATPNANDKNISPEKD